MTRDEECFIKLPHEPYNYKVENTNANVPAPFKTKLNPSAITWSILRSEIAKEFIMCIMIYLSLGIKRKIKEFT